MDVDTPHTFSLTPPAPLKSTSPNMVLGTGHRTLAVTQPKCGQLESRPPFYSQLVKRLGNRLKSHRTGTVDLISRFP